METIPEMLTYKVIICAVIFGADETLLNVNNEDGFEFKRMSLISIKDDLTSIFEIDVMGLHRDYEAARIDSSLDVICAFKSFTINLSGIEAGKYYNKMSDDALTYLDNRMREIRLFYEGPVRFKKLSIKMKSEPFYLGKTESGGSYNSIIPIGEAMGTKEISKFHCGVGRISELNKDISSVEFPLEDSLINDCHRYYDLSYHQENFVSITLLITCLEILFLSNENAKKQKLAKRCSVFLYDRKEDRLNCYNKLIRAYEDRCAFVHDGDSLSNINEDILFLRDCVRKSLIKYVEDRLIKKAVIKELKIVINNLDYWLQ